MLWSLRTVVALAAGLAALAVSGAVVSADPFEMPEVSPATQTVDGGAEFSVTYGPCLFVEEQIVFEFAGEKQEAFCGSELVAVAKFMAPTEPGTYSGIGYSISVASLRQGFRGPVTPEIGGLGAVRPAQASGPTCDGQFRCAEFSVTVRAALPPSTTATTTTTVAPTTTAVAPTTTPADVGAGAVTAPRALPATGPSQNDNTATVAIVLLVAGGAMLLMARRRTAS